MAQNWMNNDNLFLKFGTTKATVESAGDYLAYGNTRCVEVNIPPATWGAITSSVTPTILSDTVLFPPAGSSSSGAGASSSNTWFIEKVELVTTQAPSAATATPALGVGFVQWDRSTASSGMQTGLLSGISLAQLSSGAVNVFVGGAAGSWPSSAAGVGTFVGNSPSAATGPYYITANTASAGQAFSTTVGNSMLRVYYRGTGTITQ